uniref:Uncharacterized protein n=1 Tax=Anguilla anguilla TaxID=7936 RepID=A0A0E9SGI4_ANGAN
MNTSSRLCTYRSSVDELFLLYPRYPPKCTPPGSYLLIWLSLEPF